jgi:hypothetical protein
MPNEMLPSPAEARIPKEPGDFITVCAWCGERDALKILALPHRDGDVIAVVLPEDGAPLRVWRSRGGHITELFVSHGICPECKAQHFPLSAKAGVWDSRYVDETKGGD